MIIETPPQPVITAKSTSTDCFNALTPSTNTAGIGEVFFGVHLSALTAIKVRPAYQYSDDGVSWDSAVGVDLASNPNEYSSSEGWTYKSTSVDISSSTSKNFVRFGIMALNTSGSNVESALARIRLEIVDIPHGTLVSGPIKINTKVSTSVGPFTVMTDAIDSSDITALRRTLEMGADSGDIQIFAGYQVSDDKLTWEDNAGGGSGTFSTLGLGLNTTGFRYDSSFTSVTPARQYIRFGIVGRNQSATGQVEACKASLRIDWR